MKSLTTFTKPVWNSLAYLNPFHTSSEKPASQAPNRLLDPEAAVTELDQLEENFGFYRVYTVGAHTQSDLPTQLLVINQSRSYSDSMDKRE